MYCIDRVCCIDRVICIVLHVIGYVSHQRCPVADPRFPRTLGRRYRTRSLSAGDGDAFVGGGGVGEGGERGGR